MSTPDEFKKLKYHILNLSESLQTYETRFTKFIIEYDLSEEQVEAISDIFNDYLSKENPDWLQFELELLPFTNTPKKLIAEYDHMGIWKPTCRRYNMYIQDKQELEEAIKELA